MRNSLLFEISQPANRMLPQLPKMLSPYFA